MVGLVLSPGDRIEITLKDCDNGAACGFVIEWGSKLTIESLRYSDDAGRGGIIYEESWVLSDNRLTAGEFVRAVEKAHAHSHDPVEPDSPVDMPDRTAPDFANAQPPSLIVDEIAAFKERMQREPTRVRIEFADRGMELEDVMLAIQRNDIDAFRRLMIAFDAAAKKEVP